MTIKDTPTAKQLLDDLAIISHKVQDPSYSIAAHERYCQKLARSVDTLLDILIGCRVCREHSVWEPR